MPQSWQCEIEVYKATYHFIYAQKNFFTGESEANADMGVRRPPCVIPSPGYRDHNQASFTIKIACSLTPPLRPPHRRSDPGLGE